MKNLLIVTGSILFIFILISSAFSQHSDLPNPPDEFSRSENSALMSEVSTAPVAQNSLSVVQYTIKAYHQSVAVFKNNEAAPFYVSDTQLSTLPPSDRELLKKGIAVDSQKELKKRLEDLCS